MRIILQEMKKIFRPVMLLLLVIINCLMYYTFIDFDITVFPNGRPATDMYNIGVEMVEKYGHELDEVEIEDFKTVLQQEIKKADEYIQTDREFAELGITTYKQFIEERNEAFDNFDANSAFEKLHSRVVFEEGVDLFWEIPEREQIIERMEYVHERYGYSIIEGKPTKKQVQRIQEVISSGAVNTIFPSYPVGDNFQSISKSIAMTILVSVLFMISPIYIRDYKNNMIGLQYTSKIGRDLFKKKLVAGMISAFLITTVLLIVYYGLYTTNDIGMFLNSGINSFMGWLYWYDLSFLQLILVTILFTYVLTFSIALLAMFVSSICKNYISVIGILLPIFVLTEQFAITRAIPTVGFWIGRSQMELWIIYSIVIILPIMAIFGKMKKVKKQDILD